MAKSVHNNVLDASHAETATATRVSMCSGEPADFAGIAAVSLGNRTLTAGLGNGSWAVADGDTNGRKVTCAAQNAVPITASGTVNHLAYDDGVTLLRVTTCTSQVLTSGGTANIPAVDFEIADPV